MYERTMTRHMAPSMVLVAIPGLTIRATAVTRSTAGGTPLFERLELRLNLAPGR